MRYVDNVKVVSNSLQSSAAGENTVVLDTAGSERAHVLVNVGSHATTSAAWTSIEVAAGEDTNVTSHTAIAGASFATATSTAASNVLPAATATGPAGGTVLINVDLKTRPRYLSVVATKGALGTNAADNVTVLMSQNKESADSATDKAVVNLGVNTHTPSIATVNA